MMGLVAMLTATAIGVSCVNAADATAKAEPDSTDDIYTQIAKQKFGTRLPASMENPAPAPLPETQLEWNGGAAIAKMEKVDSPEKLKSALADLRSKTEPFWAEFQPKLTPTRITQVLDKMQFRLQTDADQEDFNYTLQGKGEWKEVAVPHFTGPDEQAVGWYRKVFTLSAKMKTKERLYAHFNGVDYFADVFVNGHYVGGHEGYFAPFDCEFTNHAKTGENILLVRVRNSSRFTVGSTTTGDSTNNRKFNIPRTFGDKLQSSNSPGWDDSNLGWNCCPNGFGIVQGVRIESRADKYIGDIFPRPILNATEKSVELIVEVENPSEQNQTVILKASIFGRNFKVEAAKDTYFEHPLTPTNPIKNKRPECRLTGTRAIYRITVPIPDAKLWTPETPWLYQVQVTMEDLEGKVLDTQERQFGMRTFEQRLESTPIGRFYLNGQEIRLRGANEMGNFQLDVLRRDWKQLIDDILLAKLTNMNFLRCTQTVMPPEFYDYCDRLGLMAQSDLPLFAKLSAKKATEAIKQAAEMARVVRSHPSNCLVSFFNEPSGGDGTEGHAFALKRAQVDEFFKAATVAVKLENPDQVIKLVDGDYNPPSAGMPDNHCYSGWYGNHGIAQDKLHEGYWCSVLKGWMYGCGEFGAEGLDSVQTMMKHYPKEWTATNADGSWTPDKILGSQTWSMRKYRFEVPKTMDDWVELSQTYQANNIKLKTEAFRRMPRMGTFAVHLFIDAWPNGWLKAIMDVDRNPKKAWFAYRDALASIAVQVCSPWNDESGKLSIQNINDFSYQKNQFSSSNPGKVELWICNDTNTNPDLELSYQLEMDDKILQTGHRQAKMPTVSEGSRFQGYLTIAAPKVEKVRKAFLRVSLVDNASKTIVDQYLFPIQLAPSP
ncbi:MAG: sugar-binding domain-containing protein [Verrucomicrobiota bacterium]